MENAGRGAAEATNVIAPQGDVVILAGKGNNAGDGYVIARHLELLQRNVRIVSLVDPKSLSGDALINAKVANVSDIKIIVANDEAALRQACDGAAVILDCLLGTGATGPLREPFSTAVRVANECKSTRIAIDVPTGLDCDSGKHGDPTFQADHTLTFVAAKRGFANAPRYVGKVQIVAIGVPRKLINRIAKSSSNDI